MVIEHNKSLYAYPFVFFPLFMRFFSLVFGGFSLQDEAKISAILGIGTYTVAIIVILLLLMITWRTSYKLGFAFRDNNAFFVISVICNLLVIATDKLIN